MPVITQDGNQRPDKWSFVKYDAFKRPIMTGIFTSDYSVEELQDLVNNQSVFFETYNGQNTDNHYYTNNTVPRTVANRTEQTVTYYDSYDALQFSPNNYELQQINGFEQDFNQNIKGQVAITKTLIEDPDNILNSNIEYLYSVTYYDQYYRVIQVISDNHLGGQDIFTNRYNFTGDLLETQQQHFISSTDARTCISTTNTYDRMKRPLSSTTSIDGNSSTTNFTYDELGQLSTKSIGNSVAEVNYNYNIRGWTTDITSNYFSQTMHYNTGNNPLYNGNISQIDWSSGSVNASYQYNYNGLNRILSANYSDANSADFSTTYAYDLNGNIQHLTRMGYNGSQYTEIDDLSYTYYGNQLNYVDDQNTPDHQNNGFVDNGSFRIQNKIIPDPNPTPTPIIRDYAYDANGNLIQDLNKQIYDIEYNQMNLPTKISFYDELVGEKYINYLYTPNGTKLRVQTLNGTDQNITDYVGNFVYENNELSYILFSEGRIIFDNSITFNYFITDHLGNNRALIDQNRTLLQENHYYPFGMQINALSINNLQLTIDNKYLYNGKELVTDFGLDWYEYGFRMYDAQIGRWHVADPMAEERFWLSPYQYAQNSPILRIDPDGRLDDWVITGDGASLWDDRVTNQQTAEQYYGDNATYAGNGDLYVSQPWGVTIQSDQGRTIGTTQDITVTDDGSFEIAIDDVIVTGERIYKAPQITSPTLQPVEKSFMEKSDDWANGWGPDAANFLMDINPVYSTMNSIKTMTTGKDIMGNEKNGFGQRYVSPVISVGIILLPTGKTFGEKLAAVPMTYFLDKVQQKSTENISNE